MEASTLMRDAVYVDLDNPTEYVNVSKKVCVQSRRSQSQGWKTENLTMSSRNYIANKNARCHLGWHSYYAMVNDCVKNCAAPNIVFND